MKQYITIDQLNELSEKGRKKLWEWHEEQLIRKGNKKAFALYKIADDGPKLATELMLMSIGQMIEFLSSKPQDWYDLGLELVAPDEICDYLWKEVKGKLNETS